MISLVFLIVILYEWHIIIDTKFFTIFSLPLVLLSIDVFDLFKFYKMTNNSCDISKRTLEAWWKTINWTIHIKQNRIMHTRNAGHICARRLQEKYTQYHTQKKNIFKCLNNYVNNRELQVVVTIYLTCRFCFWYSLWFIREWIGFIFSNNSIIIWTHWIFRVSSENGLLLSWLTWIANHYIIHYRLIFVQR